MIHISKSFGGTQALEDVSLRLFSGEIHALLGENGAGKSTMVKMIYGLVRPDSGTMTLRGAPYQPSKPAEARRLGVAMVFQHFSLFEALNVAENVALGMENPPAMREHLTSAAEGMLEVSARRVRGCAQVERPLTPRRNRRDEVISP